MCRCTVPDYVNRILHEQKLLNVNLTSYHENQYTYPTNSIRAKLSNVFVHTYTLVQFVHIMYCKYQ